MGERTGPLDPRTDPNAVGSRRNTTDQNIGDPALSAAVQGQPTPSNVPYQGDTRLADAVQGWPVASTAYTSSGESPEGRRINEEMNGFIAQEDAEELGAKTGDDQDANDDDDEYDDRLDDGSATDDTDEIRGDIEQTRSQMGDTLDAIEAKLSPRHIVEQVTTSVKDATIGKAEEFMSDMSERAQDLGSTFMDTLRENALPAALIGLGIGWLLMKNNSASRDRQQRYQGNARNGYRVPIEEQPYGQQQPGGNPVQRAGKKAGEALSSAQGAVSDRMSDAADNAQEAWGNVTDQAQETWGNVADQAQQAQSWLRRTYEDNPLMVGAAALVAGAAIAFAIPESPQENQWMGPTRDNLAQQAQATAQDTMQKTEQVAKKAASAARDAAQDEAQKQQLTH